VVFWEKYFSLPSFLVSLYFIYIFLFLHLSHTSTRYTALHIHKEHPIELTSSPQASAHFGSWKSHGSERGDQTKVFLHVLETFTIIRMSHSEQQWHMPPHRFNILHTIRLHSMKTGYRKTYLISWFLCTSANEILKERKLFVLLNS
jgi:hypothetical protein